MNILQFSEQFPDEQSCRDHFKIQREQTGVKCKKCGSYHHYWLPSKSQWECKSCKFRTTLRSGTIMQGSNLPLRIWYLAMVFMTHSKKGISAAELQRQLDHKRYDTIWSLMHRIRNAMGNRDELYQLQDMVEFDEGYFTVATAEGIKLKRGRGSQKKQNVAVLAESVPLENIVSGERNRQCRDFKMKVLKGQNANSMETELEKSVEEQSFVFSDKSTSYTNFSKYVEGHIMEKSDNNTNKTMLKWVHIAISNAKRTLLGIYHKIKGKYLQLYLDEFCYKLNRRYFGKRLFDRLTIAVATNYW